MKNKVQEGKVMPFVAAADVASGEAVVIGSLVGVSATAVASGDSGSAAIAEVYRLPKASAADISAGDTLIWDVSAGEVIVSGAATGDIDGFGVAFEAAGSGTDEVDVLLTPGSGTVT